MLLRSVGAVFVLMVARIGHAPAPGVPPAFFSHQLTFQDTSRGRPIPIVLYGLAQGTQKPLAVISHGYGGHDTDYGFLAAALVERGYLVASIEHVERSGDPPMVNTGNLVESRRPVWQIGADSIHFVIAELRRMRLAQSTGGAVVIGHSNGGDMSMLFTAEHPDEVAVALSLDNRRMPLPRTMHPRICSVRSSNFAADDGVLPTVTEQIALHMVIAIVPVKHEDMWDGADAKQKEAILKVVRLCLDGNESPVP